MQTQFGAPHTYKDHLQLFHSLDVVAMYVIRPDEDTDHIYNNMAINRAGAFMKNCLKWNIMSYASAWTMLCYKTVL